jgi:branched-chain amino acid transport system ATP-binding protein
LAGAQTSEVVLEAVDVVREFGGVRAVAGVSFQVRRGTLTGLIGPNGAGKSTLLAMLAGTLGVTSGKIIYEGRDVTGVAAYRRARLGLVRTFQLASEFKRLTVMENLLSAVRGNRGDTFRGSLLGKRYWGADETAAIARAEAILSVRPGRSPTLRRAQRRQRKAGRDHAGACETGRAPARQADGGVPQPGPPSRRS